GPEIAEHLGIPQVTYGLEAEAAGDALNVRRETESGYAVVSVKTPCLVTFTKPSFEVRYPTIPKKLAADKADITVLSEEDLTSIDRTQIGLAGSPTKVKKTYVPSRRKECNYVSAETLLGELRDKGALE
ncbi:MAG: electron transfer flavoprotein subunit beta, partial [Clostridia bacterium]|nr:electron transfer flavoprotein subunit beta [Clostridia bacterium]